MDLGPADNREKNMAIAKGVYEAFNRQDLDYILSNCDEHVSWGIESVGAGEVKPYGIREGRQNVAQFFAAWGETADFHAFSASDFVAVGDHVYCSLSYELTVKATGKRHSMECSAQQWTFKNGKIIRWRGYEDTAATRDAFRK